MSDIGWFRAIFAAWGVLTVVVSQYMWVGTNSATDLDRFGIYSIGLPIAAASFLWWAWRPNMARMLRAWLPITVLSLIRVADFAQDWWITPSIVDGVNVETIDGARRIGLGAYGWSMIAVMAPFVWRVEILLTARFGEPKPGEICLNAPGCPSHRPRSHGPSKQTRIRHRQRSIGHDT